MGNRSGGSAQPYDVESNEVSVAWDGSAEQVQAKYYGTYRVTSEDKTPRGGRFVPVEVVLGREVNHHRDPTSSLTQ